jgi:hypothetical protein
MRGGKVTIVSCMQMINKEKTKWEREIKEQLAQFNKASMKRFVVAEVFLIGDEIWSIFIKIWISIYSNKISNKRWK